MSNVYYDCSIRGYTNGVMFWGSVHPTISGLGPECSFNTRLASLYTCTGPTGATSPSSSVTYRVSYGMTGATGSNDFSSSYPSLDNPVFKKLKKSYYTHKWGREWLNRHRKRKMKYNVEKRSIIVDAIKYEPGKGFMFVETIDAFNKSIGKKVPPYKWLKPIFS